MPPFPDPLPNPTRTLFQIPQPGGLGRGKRCLGHGLKSAAASLHHQPSKLAVAGLKSNWNLETKRREMPVICVKYDTAVVHAQSRNTPSEVWYLSMGLGRARGRLSLGLSSRSATTRLALLVCSPLPAGGFTEARWGDGFLPLQPAHRASLPGVLMQIILYALCALAS